MSLKISIITVVKNNENGIARAIACIEKQTYKNVEHIIIDGKSTDNTWDIICKKISNNTIAIQEQDDGIYDALNKGIKLASGEIIGILHSDDCYYDDQVLQNVGERFKKKGVKIVYGDLIYVSKNNPERVIRSWIAKEYEFNQLKNGWMPPHPTMFVTSDLYKEIGPYDKRYEISADYKMILKAFQTPNITWSYISRPLVRMSLGGVSNKNFKAIIHKTKQDYQIIKECQMGGFKTLFQKNISKIPQFF